MRIPKARCKKADGTKRCGELSDPCESPISLVVVCAQTNVQVLGHVDLVEDPLHFIDKELHAPRIRGDVKREEIHAEQCVGHAAKRHSREEELVAWN